MRKGFRQAPARLNNTGAAAQSAAAVHARKGARVCACMQAACGGVALVPTSTERDRGSEDDAEVGERIFCSWTKFCRGQIAPKEKSSLSLRRDLEIENHRWLSIPVWASRYLSPAASGQHTGIHSFVCVACGIRVHPNGLVGRVCNESRIWVLYPYYGVVLALLLATGNLTLIKGDDEGMIGGDGPLLGLDQMVEALLNRRVCGWACLHPALVPEAPIGLIKKAGSK